MKVKKKRIILCVIVAFAVLVPIVATASKNLITYDEKGRVIVLAGQEKPEIPEETQTVLVAHKETEEERELRKKKENEEALAEKEQFDLAVKNSRTAIIEENPLTEKEKSEMESNLNATEKIEDTAILVLKRYYGNERIDTLMEELEKSLNISSSGESLKEYTIPESGVEVIRLMFEIIDNQDANDEEKESIINYLKTIEISGIRNDLEVKNKMQSLIEE